MCPGLRLYRQATLVLRQQKRHDETPQLTFTASLGSKIAFMRAAGIEDNPFPPSHSHQAMCLPKEAAPAIAPAILRPDSSARRAILRFRPFGAGANGIRSNSASAPCNRRCPWWWVCLLRPCLKTDRKPLLAVLPDSDPQTAAALLLPVGPRMGEGRGGSSAPIAGSRQKASALPARREVAQVGLRIPHPRQAPLPAQPSALAPKRPCLPSEPKYRNESAAPAPIAAEPARALQLLSINLQTHLPGAFVSSDLRDVGNFPRDVPGAIFARCDLRDAPASGRAGLIPPESATPNLSLPTPIESTIAVAAN
jgi:hypothetical protein